LKSQLQTTESNFDKSIKSVESHLSEVHKKLKSRIKEESLQTDEKMAKLSELAEVIDRRVKRERSDVEIQLEKYIGRIDSLNDQICAIKTFDTRIANIVVRMLEGSNLYFTWAVHEELTTLGDEKEETLPKIQSFTSRSKSGFGGQKDNEQRSEIIPLRPSFQPIEYRDVSLSKIQVLKINQNLVKEGLNYVLKNHLDPKGNELMEKAFYEPVDLNQDTKDILTTEFQNDAFLNALAQKDNIASQFTQPFLFVNTGRLSPSKIFKKSKANINRSLNNKSVELEFNLKNIPYQNLKMLDPIATKLNLKPVNKRDIYKRRSSLSKSTLKASSKPVIDLQALPSLK
jgi:hypothetical protein